MKRALRIAGCAALIIAGVVLGAVISPWPLVWLIAFPLAYAGALGLYGEIKKNHRSDPGLQREK